jgi:hypothetical protein
MPIIRSALLPDLKELVTTSVMYLVLFGLAAASQFTVTKFYESNIYSESFLLTAAFLGSILSIGTFFITYLSIEDLFSGKRALRDLMEEEIDLESVESRTELFIKSIPSLVEYLAESVNNTIEIVDKVIPTVIAFLMVSKTSLIILSYFKISKIVLQNGIIAALSSLFYLVAIYSIFTKNLYENKSIYPEN